MAHPATMRAAVAERFGAPLTLREWPVPVPLGDQVLVRLLASGVCHTDLHAIDGAWPLKARLPLVPGHEGVGVIAAVGEAVSDRRVGERVGVFWLNSACWNCDHCRRGQENLCLRQTNTGYSRAGTFADYCLVSAACAIPLPDGAPELLAPILCAGVTVHNGLMATGAVEGEWVAISGVGGIGHLAVQYARAMGLRVVALDTDEERLDQARSYGAEIALNPEREFPVSRVTRATGGVSGALITAVALKAFTQGVGMLRRGGTCVFVGIPPGAIDLSIFDVVVKQLTIRGSIVGARADVRAALDFVASGAVRATVERRPLAEVNAAIDDVRLRKVRGRCVLMLE